MQSSRFFVISILVLAAAATRALPLLTGFWNFTAVGALAVFAGSQIQDKRLAFLIPLAAMAISDIFIPYGYDPIVYAGFVAMVACGVVISKKVSITNVGLASIAGAVLFFLITNFAFLYPNYPHNINGIVLSYIAGLPFLRNMLEADLIYGAILYGSFYLLEKKYPQLTAVS